MGGSPWPFGAWRRLGMQLLVAGRCVTPAPPRSVTPPPAPRAVFSFVTPRLCRGSGGRRLFFAGGSSFSSASTSGRDPAEVAPSPSGPSEAVVTGGAAATSTFPPPSLTGELTSSSFTPDPPGAATVCPGSPPPRVSPAGSGADEGSGGPPGLASPPCPAPPVREAELP